MRRWQTHAKRLLLHTIQETMRQRSSFSSPLLNRAMRLRKQLWVSLINTWDRSATPERGFEPPLQQAMHAPSIALALSMTTVEVCREITLRRRDGIEKA